MKKNASNAHLCSNLIKESVVSDMRNQKEKNRYKASIGHIAVILLSGLMFGVCFYVLIARVFAGNSMPMPFGFGAGVVLSGSMEPELSVNDLIIVRKADGYSAGDVVVYSSGRSSVVHRVVSADEKTVVTKGDANNTSDEPISPSDISGKVIASLPKAGLVVDFLRSMPGALLLIGTALLLLELSFRGEREKCDRDLDEIRAEIARLRAQSDGGSGDDDKRSEN